MWMYMALGSALLLGCYDVAKKLSLRKNSVIWVLFATTSFSALLLSPTLKLSCPQDFLLLVPKALLVSLSWISGLVAMKLLPLTTVGVIKASRPVFVLVASIIVFGERLSLLQWAGVILALTALWMLNRSSRKEGIVFSRNKGITWMFVSVAAGVASALYDKFAVSRMDPVFVLGWSYVYTSAVMGIVLLVSRMRQGCGKDRFRFDWWLVVTAVLIVAADALYFLALSREGSMLSIVSLVRRVSVVVTFTLSAVFLKERNIRSKAVDLAVLLCAIIILFLA